MFEFATSETSGLYVGIYSGNTIEEDYERCLSSMADFEKNLRQHPKGIAVILVNDPGVPPVPASWRKRMADFNEHAQASPYLLSIVTPSSVVRGILTAINWISPAKQNQARVAHETFEQGCSWLEKQRGGPLPELAALYRVARGKLPARNVG